MKNIVQAVTDHIKADSTVLNMLAENSTWIGRGYNMSKGNSIILRGKIKESTKPVFLTVGEDVSSRLGHYSEEGSLTIRAYDKLASTGYNISTLASLLKDLLNDTVVEYNDGEIIRYKFMFDRYQPIREDEALSLLYKEITFSTLTP